MVASPPSSHRPLVRPSAASAIRNHVSQATRPTDRPTEPSGGSIRVGPIRPS